MKHFLVALLGMAVSIATAQGAEYVRMEADLAKLKSDFNASADQLRLLYIVGPT